MVTSLDVIPFIVWVPPTGKTRVCVCVCVCIYIYRCLYIQCLYIYIGFPGGSVVKNPPSLACQCKSHRFNPWVGKIPWERKWQSTSVFLPGRSHGQRSLVGYSPWACKKIRHDLGLNNNIHAYIQIYVSCCRACGILVPHQRLSPCPLHCKMES